MLVRERAKASRLGLKAPSSDDEGRAHTDSMKRIKNQEWVVGAMIMALLCFGKEDVAFLLLHEFLGGIGEIKKLL